MLDSILYKEEVFPLFIAGDLPYQELGHQDQRIGAARTTNWEEVGHPLYPFLILFCQTMSM
jgi:hypothetical protein